MEYELNNLVRACKQKRERERQRERETETERQRETEREKETKGKMLEMFIRGLFERDKRNKAVVCALWRPSPARRRYRRQRHETQRNVQPALRQQQAHWSPLSSRSTTYPIASLKAAGRNAARRAPCSRAVSGFPRFLRP